MRPSLIRWSVLFGLATFSISVNGLAAENPLGLKAHHVTAAVLDLNRAITWYQTILGFKLAQQGSHGAMQFAVLSIPGFDVALVKTPEKTPSIPPGEQGAPRWVHIVFSAPDPNQLFNALKSRGEKPYTHGGGNSGPLTSFLIQDSEGNEIEIVAEEAAAK
jgi:catechol 2,3-dioxygenase-like lactoylglutathione lyase family enzyme